jgi:hypothetical protein
MPGKQAMRFTSVQVKGKTRDYANIVKLGFTFAKK